MGAINRLMDELDITSERGRGTRIVCRKWVRRHTGSTRSCPLAFGVATRPRQPGEENGDAFVIKQWGESALVGIMDGLGHGQFAHCAAQAARQYVESHCDLPLDQIFLGVSRACHATRGVVMALARDIFARHGRALLAGLPVALILAAAGGYHLVTINPFNPLQLQNPATFAVQLVNIAGYYAVLLPFFFLSGLYISLNFVLNDEDIGRVYGFDLTGAGTGALAVLGLMSLVHPFALVPCLLAPLAVSAVFAPVRRK